MARTMYAGDTYPPLLGEASDANGNPLNLSTATSMQVNLKSPTHTITEVATAIWPAQVDPDGIHEWNWTADFAVGDTSVVGEYNVELVITWSAGNIETIGGDTLTIVSP